MNFTISIILFLLYSNGIQTTLYKFNEGYCEFWYQIPLTQIFSTGELFASDSIIKQYAYEIILYSQETRDSISRKGIKGTVIKAHQKTDCVIDCFPLYLYSGKFNFKFVISPGGELIVKEGVIEVIPETTLFYLSDIVLSKAGKREHIFHRKIDLFPLIIPEYTNMDTLFAYIEIYGLVPDSLFYEIHYRIIDNSSSIVLDKAFMRVKFDYDQFDTISIPLQSYVNGDYSLVVEVFDPALNLRVQRGCGFRVKELLPEVLDKRFAWEIKYLVSEKEYKKFQKMDYSQQVDYLKRFWAKRNYEKFEKRLIEADDKFSTPFMRGRDTPMGRCYILNGPPDEIKKYGEEYVTRGEVLYGKAHTGEPKEIWVYGTKGVQVLFMDKDKDGIYEFIGISKIGEEESEDNLKEREVLWNLLFRND